MDFGFIFRCFQASLAHVSTKLAIDDGTNSASQERAVRSIPGILACALCGRFVLRARLLKTPRSTSLQCDHASAPSIYIHIEIARRAGVLGPARSAGRPAKRPGTSWLARSGVEWLDLAALDALAGSIWLSWLFLGALAGSIWVPWGPLGVDFAAHGQCFH